MSALDAPVGSRVRLGKAEFHVAAVLTLEPERSANFFNVAPRLMMNAEDLGATGLIQTGSRVWHYLSSAGPAEKVGELERFSRTGWSAASASTISRRGRPEVRAAIERAQRFLGLTALLAAVLAGVAIALGTRRFVERHLDGCAVMRCLGATQGKLMSLYGIEFVVLGIAACLVGTLIGFGAAGAHRRLARRDGARRAARARPAARGAGLLVGLVLLLGFALPPLVRLGNVPAVRVIRRETAGSSRASLISYLVGAAALAGLLDLAGGRREDGRLRGRRLRRGDRRLFPRRLDDAEVPHPPQGRAALRFAAALRNGQSSASRAGQRGAGGDLALGLTAVLLLTITRNDLVDAWRRSAPPDAPNRFLVGVQPDQLAAACSASSPSAASPGPSSIRWCAAA